jgi:hypothetical protein
MFHAVISDTHSPKPWNTSIKYFKKLVQKYPLIDCLVMNGDILTNMSMDGSILHPNKIVSKEQKKEYLQLGSPVFFEKFERLGIITNEMVIGYVKERYDWAYNELKNISKIKKTIFNLGNHESEFQLLVLRELVYLTDTDESIINTVSKLAVKEIIKDFEKRLYELEKTSDFHYIRNKPLIIDDTMIMGIPGISHATVGNDPTARFQEDHTKFLINQVNKNIHNVSKLIIYNHTQGNYDKKTGKFDCASPSLKNFMMNLPSNITKKIFVQSHNHWSYTQFMNHSGFDYVVNNAGLHAGLFNLIEFSNDTNVYDCDPNNEKVIKLKINKTFEPYDEDDDGELISRNYDDFKFVLKRKKTIVINDEQKSIQTNSKVDIKKLKSSIFK